MRIGRLSLVLACAALFFSCEYLSQIQNLTIELPRLPAPWKERIRLDAFRLSYIDEHGGLYTRVIDGGQRETEIETIKGFVIPVMAEPLARGLKLPPSGGLYPIDREDERCLALSWKRGVVCSILLELASREIVLDCINTERLCREIEARSCGDPFRLDRVGIMESLVSGRFRVTDIKPLPSREISFCPGAGVWFTESPFSLLYETETDEILHLTLSYGYHHLFDRLSQNRYDIQISEEETIILEVTE
jgi:hypothetical protein